MGRQIGGPRNGNGSERRIVNGVAAIDSASIDADTAAAISEISHTREGIRIKMHDKRAALVDIGRHLGMFKDKVELTGKDEGPLEMKPSVVELDFDSVMVKFNEVMASRDTKSATRTQEQIARVED